mmetsp:Transcript_17446/g.45800  ORF Transcript_17446/g.45800 Transcript_17446/m.45800 type:complete len:226 (-) Transcript_17446:263-940(-)
MPVGLAASTWPNSFDFSRARKAPENANEIARSSSISRIDSTPSVVWYSPSSTLYLTVTRPGIRDHSSFTASMSLPTGASATTGGMDASTSGSTTPSSQPASFSVAAIAAIRADRAVSKSSSSSSSGASDAPMSRMRRATASFTCGVNDASGSFSTSRTYSPSERFSNTPSIPGGIASITAPPSAARSRARNAPGYARFTPSAASFSSRAISSLPSRVVCSVFESW